MGQAELLQLMVRGSLMMSDALEGSARKVYERACDMSDDEHLAVLRAIKGVELSIERAQADRRELADAAAGIVAERQDVAQFHAPVALGDNWTDEQYQAQLKVYVDPRFETDAHRRAAPGRNPADALEALDTVV